MAEIAVWAHALGASMIRESEVPLLPPNMPKIEAAHILLASEDSGINGPMDIFKIIESCLKESKPLNWHNPIRAICYFYLFNLLCRGVALALMVVAARRATLPPSLIRSYSLVRLIFAAVGWTFCLSLNPLTAGV